MKTTRRLAKLVLPIVGLFLAFLGVLFLEGNIPKLFAVLAGILLVEAGVWNAANPFGRSPRKYLELRSEVEGFLQQVRQLNAAATEARMFRGSGSWQRYRATVDAMHESVERMARVAGKEEGMKDLTPAPQDPAGGEPGTGP
ncbi:MAG: hypothetical protein WD013_01540 [Gemmatimonadota bacterium]